MEGFIVKSTGTYFGEEYVLHSKKDIEKQENKYGIAIHEKDLEKFVAYTYDGNSYKKVNRGKVTVSGIISNIGPISDASQYPLKAILII